MAWRRPGDKPLSEPMMVCFLTHICVTRLQWVNIYHIAYTKINTILKAQMFSKTYKTTTIGITAWTKLFSCDTLVLHLLVWSPGFVENFNRLGGMWAPAQRSLGEFSRVGDSSCHPPPSGPGVLLHGLMSSLEGAVPIGMGWAIAQETCLWFIAVRAVSPGWSLPPMDALLGTRDKWSQSSDHALHRQEHSPDTEMLQDCNEGGLSDSVLGCD